ncbi:MAG: hypothetical protein IJ555_09880 [Ruminococcus sp.]|nr:hypothetical protein [Ruminococcus sp.]
MKVAGGLLLVIGLMLAAITFMYQNDTGRSSPFTLIVGIIIAVVGIVVITMKPKDKKDK